MSHLKTAFHPLVLCADLGRSVFVLRLQDFYVEKTDEGIAAAHDFIKYTLGDKLLAKRTESIASLTDSESPEASDIEKEEADAPATDVR